MPPSSIGYLQEYLMEVGPAQPGPGGPQELSFEEILAWQVCMRRLLQPWEIAMLKRMSQVYAAELVRAEEDPSRAAPWTDDSMRPTVAKDLRAALRRKAS